MFNLEDDPVDLLLEHQCLTTPARHLYLACWFLYLDSLRYRCLFLIYPHSTTSADDMLTLPCVGSHRMRGCADSSGCRIQCPANVILQNLILEETRGYYTDFVCEVFLPRHI